MAILIDGYNLLNATGVEGTGRGTELERARRGLLQFLAAALTAEERAGTTLVFDAQNAPPGLPQHESFHGMTVLFSRGYPEADDLIEELIAADHSPRRLFVISSDHRLHRAARRRKATAIDSDIWYAGLEARNVASPSDRISVNPGAELSSSEQWLAEFSNFDIASIEKELADEPAPPDAATTSPDVTNDIPKKKRKPPAAKEGLPDAKLNALTNPFPDDFGSELNEEFTADDDPTNPFPPGFGKNMFEGDEDT